MDYSCKNIRNMLPTYLDNMMNEMDAKTIEKHLNNCASCRREYEFLKSIMETAADLPEIEVSDNFNETLHKNLVEAKNKKRSLSFKSFRKIAVATLSTAAVIAISVVSLGNLIDKDITTPIEENVSNASIEDNTEIVYDEENVQVSEVIDETIDETEQAEEESTVEETSKAKKTIAKIFGASQNRTDKSSKSAKAEKKSSPFDFNDTIFKIGTNNFMNEKEKGSSKEESEEKSQKKENQKASRISPKITLDVPNATNDYSVAKVFEDAIAAAPGGDAKEESASKGAAQSAQTPAQSTSGGGSSSGTPEKVKVTANVKVKESDNDLARKILSDYEYSDGEYALSNSEYKEVMSQFDAMGASITLSKENKTERYEELSDSLENPTASTDGQTSSQIQSEINQIDDETSKKFVRLD